MTFGNRGSMSSSLTPHAGGGGGSAIKSYQRTVMNKTNNLTTKLYEPDDKLLRLRRLQQQNVSTAMLKKAHLLEEKLRRQKLHQAAATFYNESQSSAMDLACSSQAFQQQLIPGQFINNQTTDEEMSQTNNNIIQQPDPNLLRISGHNQTRTLFKNKKVSQVASNQVIYSKAKGGAPVQHGMFSQSIITKNLNNNSAATMDALDFGAHYLNGNTITGVSNSGKDDTESLISGNNNNNQNSQIYGTWSQDSLAVAQSQQQQQQQNHKQDNGNQTKDGKTPPSPTKQMVAQYLALDQFNHASSDAMELEQDLIATENAFLQQIQSQDINIEDLQKTDSQQQKNQDIKKEKVSQKVEQQQGTTKQKEQRSRNVQHTQSESVNPQARSKSGFKYVQPLSTKRGSILNPKLSPAAMSKQKIKDENDSKVVLSPQAQKSQSSGGSEERADDKQKNKRGKSCMDVHKNEHDKIAVHGCQMNQSSHNIKQKKTYVPTIKDHKIPSPRSSNTNQITSGVLNLNFGAQNEIKLLGATKSSVQSNNTLLRNQMPFNTFSSIKGLQNRSSRFNQISPVKTRDQQTQQDENTIPESSQDSPQHKSPNVVKFIDQQQTKPLITSSEGGNNTGGGGDDQQQDGIQKHDRSVSPMTDHTSLMPLKEKGVVKITSTESFEEESRDDLIDKEEDGDNNSGKDSEQKIEDESVNERAVADDENEGDEDGDQLSNNALNNSSVEVSQHDESVEKLKNRIFDQKDKTVRQKSLGIIKLKQNIKFDVQIDQEIRVIPPQRQRQAAKNNDGQILVREGVSSPMSQNSIRSSKSQLGQTLDRSQLQSIYHQQSNSIDMTGSPRKPNNGNVKLKKLMKNQRPATKKVQHNTPKMKALYSGNNAGSFRNFKIMKQLTMTNQATNTLQIQNQEKDKYISTYSKQLLDDPITEQNHSDDNKEHNKMVKNSIKSNKSRSRTDVLKNTSPQRCSFARSIQQSQNTDNENSEDNNNKQIKFMTKNQIQLQVKTTKQTTDNTKRCSRSVSKAKIMPLNSPAKNQKPMKIPTQVLEINEQKILDSNSPNHLQNSQKSLGALSGQAQNQQIGKKHAGSKFPQAERLISQSTVQQHQLQPILTKLNNTQQLPAALQVSGSSTTLNNIEKSQTNKESRQNINLISNETNNTTSNQNTGHNTGMLATFNQFAQKTNNNTGQHISIHEKQPAPPGFKVKQVTLQEQQIDDYYDKDNPFRNTLHIQKAKQHEQIIKPNKRKEKPKNGNKFTKKLNNEDMKQVMNETNAIIDYKAKLDQGKLESNATQQLTPTNQMRQWSLKQQSGFDSSSDEDQKSVKKEHHERVEADTQKEIHSQEMLLLNETQTSLLQVQKKKDARQESTNTLNQIQHLTELYDTKATSFQEGAIYTHNNTQEGETNSVEEIQQQQSNQQKSTSRVTHFLPQVKTAIKIKGAKKRSQSTLSHHNHNTLSHAYKTIRSGGSDESNIDNKKGLNKLQMTQQKFTSLNRMIPRITVSNAVMGDNFYNKTTISPFAMRAQHPTSDIDRNISSNKAVNIREKNALMLQVRQENRLNKFKNNYDTTTKQSSSLSNYHNTKTNLVNLSHRQTDNQSPFIPKTGQMEFFSYNKNTQPIKKRDIFDHLMKLNTKGL